MSGYPAYLKRFGTFYRLVRGYRNHAERNSRIPLGKVGAVVLKVYVAVYQ